MLDDSLTLLLGLNSDKCLPHDCSTGETGAMTLETPDGRPDQPLKRKLQKFLVDFSPEILEIGENGITCFSRFDELSVPSHIG